MNILESVRLSGSKVQVLWTALPLAALFLTGCPIYNGDAPPLACTLNTDCPSGQECVGGSCTPVSNACTSDTRCGTGMHCQGGSCVPGTRTCETHGDCDPGFMCDVSSCETSSTCHADADCAGSPAGNTAWCDYRDTCVPHTPGQCRADHPADCTGTDLCIEGMCTTLPTTCQFDHDCPAGTSCVNAECTAICTNDAGCVAGDVCNSSHRCEPMTDCSTSATCATGEHCVGGRCLVDCHASGALCPTAGRETSYCAQDSFCHPSWQPQPTCNMDSDCQTGRLCLAHVCRTPCPTMMDTECTGIDSQLPHCALDTASSHYLCNATGATPPECRTQMECTGGADCVNASCQ